MINRPIATTIVSAVCLMMLLSVAPSNLAAMDQLSSGTNSRQAKKQAIKSIPYSQLTPPTRSKIANVLENPSIYRRLPITSIDVDPDMFLFLVRYPEVVVNIWQIMGVTQMTVDRTGPFNMKSDDGVGAVSDVELVYGTSNMNIYYAEGTYSGPLLRRKLKGQCVMILQTKYERGKNGKPKAVNSLDVFVKVENATVGLIAKTLNPIVGPTADHNFVESLNFVQRLNKTTEQNGVGVQRMSNRLTNIDDGVRDKFTQLAGTVYERGARRSAPQNKPHTHLSNKGSNAGTLPSSIPVYAPNAAPNPATGKIRRTSYRDYQYGLSK